ncbi:MAG: type II secretion system F family protein, partial [Firmicutes bacterium]|nr:type II secretion system F family protein [Bacillota bacterium]
GWQAWLLLAALGLITYLFFGVHIRTRAQARRRELERELPEIFDLLSVSVEAGLSFEGALRRVVVRLKGVAGEEFGRVVSDLAMGSSRNEALRALAARTGSRLLLRFANLMAQSSRTGAGVGPALRALARDVKEERLARVREAAAQLPVKLLFPMIVFILPTLFAIVLGPGIYSILRSLGGKG